MNSWFEIVVPHSMIQSGHIKESIFVADLGDIIQGSAPTSYSDPQMFFERTYLTRGLLNLLNKVQAKLCDDKGSGIVKLQTPFGGGKTHALITIYHYVMNGPKITEFLPRTLPTLKAKVATIIGTHLNPLEGRKCHNIRINTIWGEIAYQLAGIEGYKEFEANDIKRISPGKEKLRKFLVKYEPFLLLLDEIVEYVTKARGVSINESNLGTQTLLFLQELTETLASLTQSLMFITLPVHKHEDFSEITLDVISRMNRIMGRVETTETPVERDELDRLVAKRLIHKILLQEERDEIISKYMKIYQRRRNELPDKIQYPSYNERMKDSYPFHPEVIDFLYDRWNTLQTFQGTRAILRILSHILSSLWISKAQLDLILLSNIDLHNSSLRNEFLRHIDEKFERILDSDVIGTESGSRSLDIRYSNWNDLVFRTSQTIFLSSFSKHDGSKGLTPPEIRLNVIRPNIPISLISEVLLQVYGALYFLHLEDGRYFFSHQPNLNRKIQDIKELYQENYEEEMQKVIKKHIGKEIKNFIWPKSSNEIPDNRKLKIAVIHPSIKKESLINWIENKGTTFRQNKNTLLFVLPNDSHLSDFQDLIQIKLALNELHAKITQRKEDHYNFDSEIIQRQHKIEDSLSYAVRKTYSLLFDGTQTITLGLPPAEYETLTKWYHRELLAREYIVSKLHYRKLEDLLFSSNNYISTQQILEQFFINPDSIKIESSNVIQQTICWGVEEGAFGIGILSNNTIQANSFFFSVKLSPSQVSFSSGEILISMEFAKEIKTQLANNPEMNEVRIPKDREKASPEDLIFKTTSKTQIKPQEYHSFSVEVQELKSKLLPAFYRGVLKPLESKNAEITMEIKLDVKCEQEIPATIIDTTIKETITQLGAQLTRIKKKG